MLKGTQTISNSPHNQNMDLDLDLTNCDREPIHIIGRVQSFGALISVSSDWLINHVSSNIGPFIGYNPDNLIGQSLTQFFLPETLHDIRSRIQMLGSKDAVDRLFGIALTDNSQLFDIALHKSDRSIIIEVEKASHGNQNDYIGYVRPMIDRISKTESVQELCDSAARHIKALTGFDRVMVYRFNHDDSGTVISECLKSGMESFKGLRYPASDIPKQARALYTRNLLRIISDVNDPGHEIIPQKNPNGDPLDLSLSSTRAVSPIHLEYLRNMGVGASMSISILRRGKLWGLIACHHDQSKTLPYSIRTAADLFAQLFSFILDQKEGDVERATEVRGRLLHDQIMIQLAEGKAIFENFNGIVSSIGSAINFDGAIGWIEDSFISKGNTPSKAQFINLLPFLNTLDAGRIYATDSLAKHFPAAKDFADQAAGILVLPVSRQTRDFIVLFRREIAKSVTWAGNPDKPVELGPSGSRLSPRKSFKAWQEMVSNHSQPWSQQDIGAAEYLRVTLLEVILRITDASHIERVKSQEKQEILIAELNHRVRNILNLIRSLINQTKGEARTVADFTEIVGGRIHALARAHDQITAENWAPASVYDLIQTEANAYLGGKGERILIEGKDAMIVPNAFSTLSLVIHELVTNSAKYGALCDNSGKVIVKITEAKNGDMEIKWREIGGPPIRQTPSRRGFGMTIIERSIPYELKGTSDIKFAATGLEAKFIVPKANVETFAETRSKSVTADRPNEETDFLLSGQVLLVEDNIIIAMEAEDLLLDLGADKVHVASSVHTALEIINTNDVSFALLDVNLGTETSEPVANELVKANIPFVFATGYGDVSSLKEQFPNVRFLTKPYDKTSAMGVISASRKS